MQEDKHTAFEKYYMEYYAQVYKYILKKISNPVQAEDLAMDSFVSCYQKFDTFDSQKASFATWIYVIANNKLKNYYRDHKITSELDENIESPENFEDEIASAVFVAKMRNELAVALEKLPEIQRNIVIHKYFNNKNANDISLIVGVSPGNVRVLLSRALKKLKEYFLDKNIEWEN